MKFSWNELKRWYRNPLINPQTNRKIKQNGPTYQKLKDAYDHVQKGRYSYSLGAFQIRTKGEDYFILQENNGFLWASVFDGHAGHHVAEFLQKNTINMFKKISSSETVMPDVLFHTYAALEKEIQKMGLPSGSTATTLLIHPKTKKAYLANTGDSRIIGCLEGKAVPLTNDHKPKQMDEYKRIRAAGDDVVFSGTWRVGSLAVSRVFGDLDVKASNPSVIATPEIFTYNLKGFSHFVLASDGLYDVCSNEEIIKFIMQRRRMEPNKIAKELAHLARDKGSQDDITVIIVQL